MAEINRIYVSPGVYTSDMVDMKAAANSVGITKLALVGETLKGPAFQSYWVHSPKEYASVFGGTSTKMFYGSKYPRYELPYIANEYLKKSTELCVVRTLGFSGYNAGPAWVITGQKGSESGSTKCVIAVLRSRGGYKYRSSMANVTTSDGCPCGSAFDSITYQVGEISELTSCDAPISYNMDAVKLDEYYSPLYSGNDCNPYTISGSNGNGFTASYGNLGRFTIKCLVGQHAKGTEPDDSESTVKIPVSLNKSDKDYIIKVLGTSNDDGDQPLYVETLYDTAWEDLVMNEGYNIVSSGLTVYNVDYISDYSGLEPVYGILTKHEAELKKSDLGKRFLYSEDNGSPSDVSYYVYSYSSNTALPISVKKRGTIAQLSADTATTINIGEVFELTDSNYIGYYENVSDTSKLMSLLMESTTFGGYRTDSLVKKLTTTATIYKTDDCQDAYIYTVKQITDAVGKKHYVYTAYDKTETSGITDSTERIAAQDYVRPQYNSNLVRGSIVYNTEDGLYYKNSGLPKVKEQGNRTASNAGVITLSNVPKGNLYFDGFNGEEVLYSGPYSNPVERNSDGTWTIGHAGLSWNLSGGTITSGNSYHYYVYENENGVTVIDNKTVQVVCDLNDYKTPYRYASTPWIVSNVKGDAKNIEVNKLFRFHTISDGKGANTEVKVSIENIRPDSGEFDVVVRSYGDTDYNVNVLERFSKCTMSSGKSSIAYKIGTLDGSFESKSNYITVELADGNGLNTSVPAGFMGYSEPMYDGATITSSGITNVTIAPITYNTNYDEDTPKRKQYFGLSDITGYDLDYFTFKGNMASIEGPDFMTHGFHLDCRVSKDSYNSTDVVPNITVDGVEGYVFDSVSVNARTNNFNGTPIISTENEMSGCIFEDVKLRKFTVMFAGGFDGWDEYREQRTNTDDYSYTTYKGYINKTSGVGYGFDIMKDADSYGIDSTAITSDYYSTLAGVSLLKNPEETDINLLATPGIDTINNTKLVNDIFDIVDERADTFYVVTSPDKELGASDYSDDIMPVDEFTNEFNDKEIYCDNAATYYPWVKIEDNGKYIWLPPTRDVIRDIAESDNTNTTMNFAPAGTTRGKVDAIRARKNIKNAESDELYESRVNPLRTYAQEGIVIMGQKTLRKEDDLMNRIDVRRMVLRMRKLIAIACLGLIFEPNDNNTVKAFRSIISGIMQTFIDNRAIKKWTMDVDDSQEARDRMELSATIYVMPVRALEFISLNFVVTNNEVYFEP